MRASFGVGIAAVAALVCGACNGFPKAAPGETAHAERGEKFPTWQPSPATQPLTVDRQTFVYVAAPVRDMPATLVSGATQRAVPLPWDQPPFDQLFVLGQDRLIHSYQLVY